VFFIFMKDRQASRARHAAEASPSPGASADTVTRPDDDIQKDIKRALRANPSLRRQNIDIEVDDGMVTLSGHLPSGALAHEAEQAARGVAGVKDVTSAFDVEQAEAPERPEGSPNPNPNPFPAAPGAPRPPGAPDIHPIIPGVTAEHVQEMLREGHKAMDRGAPEEALAIFGSVLVMDPSNKEARDGMRDAGKAMGAKAKVDQKQLQEQIQKDQAQRQKDLEERLRQQAEEREQAQRDREAAARERARRHHGPSPSPSPSS
jgi:osmotically-inducible protein OsmY